MYQDAWRAVALPNGRSIRVSENPENWPKLGETGFVPFDAVLPDPHQPRDTREYTQSEDHVLLSQSTKSRAQGLIIRVRPFSQEDLVVHAETNPRARYWIVDGERRYHACGPNGADLGVLEINVHPYQSGKEIFLDQVVLNSLQLSLSTPELVRALAKIREDYDVRSANALAKMVNMPQVKVSRLWHMTNLAPELLELTNEQKYKKHERGARLTEKPATELAQIMGADGKTAHERQREIYADARARGVKGADQLCAFFVQFHEEAQQESRARRRPKRQRNRIRALVEIISHNDLLRTSDGDLSAMLGTASKEELLLLASDLSQASTKLRVFSGKVQDSIGVLLQAAQTVQQRSTPPPVSTPVAAKKPKVKKVTAAPSKPSKRAEAKTPARKTLPKLRGIETAQPRSNVPHGTAAGNSVHTPRRPDKAASRAELIALTPRPIRHSYETELTQSPEQAQLRALFKDELNVQAWSTQSGRIALVSLHSAEEYLKLYREQAFKYQREGTDRPSHYPDPELVASLMEKCV